MAVTRGTRIGQIAAAAVVGAALTAGWSTPASAETNPSWTDSTQIGTTARIVIDGATFASVKQYKGCGKNWAYGYVWESWRSSLNDCTRAVGYWGNRAAARTDERC